MIFRYVVTILIEISQECKEWEIDSEHMTLTKPHGEKMEKSSLGLKSIQLTRAGNSIVDHWGLRPIRGFYTGGLMFTLYR